MVKMKYIGEEAEVNVFISPTKRKIDNVKKGVLFEVTEGEEESLWLSGKARV